MTLYFTDWAITSDVTPEWASRVAEHGTLVWRLSWLKDRPLTREQATAGMQLDERLSDPAQVNDRRHLAEIDDCADRLGLMREQAIILLAKRIAARLEDDAQGEEQAADRAFDSLRMAKRIIEPPYAHQ
ncbi:hypothetical protein [Nocardia sp. NPDC052566]|uniref:hypothetical protein n=1 Tax=Nocardia sp. NPDC052566 TaxID=3364330 RepID=UPI0037CB84FE